MLNEKIERIMNTTKLTFDKGVCIHTPGYAPEHYNVKGAIERLKSSHVGGCIAVQWRVVESAPVSVDNQNATMLRRAHKIAGALNMSVGGFHNVNHSLYGCVLE
jgi:hypothetical protein